MFARLRTSFYTSPVSCAARSLCHFLLLESWRRRLVNYRDNLLLVEERMSEYVEFTDIPLQLVKNKRQVEASISDLEQKLGLRTPD